jgi:hypothetical protein
VTSAAKARPVLADPPGAAVDDGLSYESYPRLLARPTAGRGLVPRLPRKTGERPRGAETT